MYVFMETEEKYPLLSSHTHLHTLSVSHWYDFQSLLLNASLLPNFVLETFYAKWESIWNIKNFTLTMLKMYWSKAQTDHQFWFQRSKLLDFRGLKTLNTNCKKNRCWSVENGVMPAGLLAVFEYWWTWSNESVYQIWNLEAVALRVCK